jgi:hypothetical protein
MTVDFALRLASAAARVLAPKGGRVIIGKDTRVSGYMFEAALEAGFVAAGVDVWLTGPMPTPGIALSLAITVRSRLRWRTSSTTTRSGVPTPMNPPMIRRAPSGIIATASCKEMVFMK